MHLVLVAIKRIDWKSLHVDTRLSVCSLLILLNSIRWNYEDYGISHDACGLVSGSRCLGITPSVRGPKRIYRRRSWSGNNGIGAIHTRSSESQKGA